MVVRNEWLSSSPERSPPKQKIHSRWWLLVTPPAPSMATALSLSSSSFLHHCAKSTSRSSFSCRLRASLSTPSSSMAATAEKVVPAVIVGGGRVGKAFQDMGGGGDVLVKRGEAVPLDFAGPILVCTRNDDLDAVLESTPKSRWSGMILKIFFPFQRCLFLGSLYFVGVWLFWLMLIVPYGMEVLLSLLNSAIVVEIRLVIFAFAIWEWFPSVKETKILKGPFFNGLYCF